MPNPWATLETPKPAVPAAPSPSLPAAPSPAGVLPPDPTYDATVAGATKTHDTDVARLQGNRTRGLQDFGYNASTDPSGNVTGLTFDPNNPYSKAALLLRHYRNQQRGAATSMAARGQLYAGAFQNAQDAVSNSYNQAYNAQQKALLAFLAGNSSDLATTNNAYEGALGSATAGRIQRAPGSPLYDPATAGTAAGQQAAMPAHAAGNWATWKPGPWNPWQQATQQMFRRRR